MKRLTKTTLLVAASAALFSQAAYAQVPPGDIVLAFSSQNTPSGNDYILDLGAFGTSGSGLSGSSFNLANFNTVFSGNVNPITAAAVGGSGAGVGEKLFLTELHGAAGPATVTGTSIASAISTANGIALSFSGNPPGVIPSANSQSWTSLAPNFAGQANNDPRNNITGSSIVLDLYEGVAKSTGGSRPTTTINSWADVGTITVDLTGGTASFTPTAVPEPGTYGLLAGAGLLIVSLRRHLVRQQA